jgi:phosphinothricin acetyltransferase
MIRPVSIDDAGAIADIYNYYIHNTVITFEEETVVADAMAARIREVTRAHPWLVWEESGEVCGYAYAHQWRERASYRFSVEDSIYLKHGCEGRGTGSALFSRLLDELRKGNARAVVAGITLPNARSTAMHEKFGFSKIGEFAEIGYKTERWLTVGFWELLLHNPQPARG